MDTRIWMQESFWESAEEQNGKESPQENAEHLSKDQNENGGNKLVDQKTSLWQQTYENILVGMGMCVITTELSSIKLYPAVRSVFLMIFAGTAEIEGEKTDGFRSAYAACWDQTAMLTMISIVIVGTYIGREQNRSMHEAWKIVSILVWAYALPLLIFILFLLRYVDHRIKETW